MNIATGAKQNAQQREEFKTNEWLCLFVMETWTVTAMEIQKTILIFLQVHLTDLKTISLRSLNYRISRLGRDEHA